MAEKGETKQIKEKLIKYLIFSIIFLLLWEISILIIVWYSDTNQEWMIFIFICALLLPLLMIYVVITAYINEKQRIQNKI